MQRDAPKPSLELLSIAMTALVSVLLLGACGSTPNSRFYVLTPRTPAANGITSPSMRVGLEPVMIPDAFDRPQMLMTIGDNERVLWEFDR